MKIFKNGYTPNEGNWGAWLHAMGKLKSLLGLVIKLVLTLIGQIL